MKMKLLQGYGKAISVMQKGLGHKKTGVFLAKLGDAESLLGPTIIVIVLLLLIGVVSIVLRIYLLAFLSLAAACGLIVLFIAGRRLYKESQQSQLEEVVFQYLKKKGVMNFELKRLFEEINAPYDRIRKACIDVYRRCATKALDDFIITKNERRVLHTLQEKLSVSPEAAARIEENIKEKMYDQELSVRLHDEVLTKKEAFELKEIRKLLGLTDSQVREATNASALDGYRILFSRFARDGLVSTADLKQLEDLRKATGMTAAEAARLSEDDALTLYRRTVAMVCQDGVVTDEEQRVIDGLEHLLQLRKSLTAPFRSQVDKTRKLDLIRKGKLPIVKHDQQLHLKSSELCHWHHPCKHAYKTRTRAIELAGNLVVTSRRVIFYASERSFDFSAKKIVNIQLRSDAVQLTLSTTRGQGTYYTENPEILEAILEALVRRYNYTIAEKLDKAKSRHIPDNVKVIVWQRDGAKCVRCGATEYLEYDHIIPFSKGGSNSEMNIQLLCRKCNLAKGGELV